MVTSNKISNDFKTIGKETINLMGDDDVPPTKTQSGGGHTTSTNLLGDDDDLLGGGSNVGGSGKHHLESHPLFYNCEGKIALKGQVIEKPNRLPNPPNSGELKALITTENGVLVDNDLVTINYKSSFDGATGKLAMQFVSNGPQMKNVSFEIPDHPNIQFQVSPVNTSGEHPSCVV
mmetsp:Transcript_2677/g.2326  ORF Transcript_2677/g.2326 Transcript_2677/m.2326 type:complete len:176 (-) Transcript_2677:663-1190(-)